MASDRRWNGLALIVAVLAVAVAAGYVWLMAAYQHDPPVLWFVAGLLLSALLSGYAANTGAPGRTAALAVSGAILIALGVLSSATIGWPIIGIGVVAIVASARSRENLRA